MGWGGIPNENEEIKPLLQRARIRNIVSLQAILKETMWPVGPVGHWSRWCLAEIQQVDGDAHTPQRVVVRVLPWRAGESGFDRRGAVRVNVVDSLVQACGDGQAVVMVPLAEETAHVLCSLWGILREVRWIIRNMHIMCPHNEFGMTPCGMVMNPGHIFRHEGISLDKGRYRVVTVT